ncbi:MAG: tRNA glutamyl-Q(34) synthetase GluQRS [Caulobacter sp.]|nr:tRNA glutamyl-Q(34) synthetase GluQRS [Caulobacter sp.]
MITRFAPSPTGRLHRGHAFSALTAFTAARTAGGRFLLRIEDIDQTRCRPAHEADLLADLAWLGLEWEQPVRRQSEHMVDYEAALDQLISRGLVYRCFRTRKDLAQAAQSAPHGPAEPFVGGPIHPHEEDRWLAEGKAFAWRLSLAAAHEALGGFHRLTFQEQGQGPAGERGRFVARPELTGDVVLARKDVGVAYHLAVVVDDALQGITHVIRGQDLFEACHVQRLLQALLDLPTPTYRHHRLILDAAGERLAKRKGGETLTDLRTSGMTGAQLRADLGFGW